MTVDNQFKPHQTTLDEICEGLSPDGKYSHLQVFLYRIGSTHKIGQQYLFVSRTAFGKVKLIDINYHENLIKLELQDSFSAESSQFTLDINDKEFRFLMIAWEDILYMLKADSNNLACDKLPES
ncbi:MAG: hypothetical protein ABR974_14325 [Bacteroidales bacterium]|jgi:hypothetical protein